ncbi:MAG: hypothetical protein H6668_22975 [Ardenticatenaceae bacterium]|nr:hypothetical protein [Ardenticatenaceae bacterium]
MRLRRYLNRIYDTLRIRQEIRIVSLRVEEIEPNQEGLVEARLQFWDGSQLYIDEVLLAQGSLLVKTPYAYHYQDAQSNLIFRYDDAPHHPHLSTHPHHKHTPQGVVEANPPDIADVLKEIDELLYGAS